MPSADAFDHGLLSPGTAGADGTVSDAAIAQALIEVEDCYLRSLVAVGIAPATIGSLEGADLPALDELARTARDGGNPIVPLIAHLRGLVDPVTATWIHRGATSQDIVDTAIMLVSQRARVEILAQLDATIDALAALTDVHRTTVAAARTLTQHSTPTTYGLRFATWLGGVIDARDALATLPLPVQLGGASGTLAALVALSDPARAAAVPAELATQLGLAESPPWHTSRAPVTRLGDALAGVTDALGVIAANVATLARTEIAELAEPTAEGRGGSSTMPQKHNPVLSVLIRSSAIRAPALASTLHLCAALAVDERPDGAWHAEWPTLRELLRLALGASANAAELTAGLTVDQGRVAANLALTGDELVAEHASVVSGPVAPAGYTGLSDALIDAALARARS